MGPEESEIPDVDSEYEEQLAATKKKTAPKMSKPKMPKMEMNPDRITYHESRIRNMKMFSDELQQMCKTVVS